MKTLKGIWILDSNLLVYALDKNASYYPQTVDLFKSIQAGTFKSFVTIQTVTETVNVFIRYYKYSISQTIESVQQLREAFHIDLLTPRPSTISIFFALLKQKRKTRSVYDIFLAATIIDNGYTNLLTVNDKDFRGIKELQVMNPFKK